ncbi:T9SS type A sorting domain-containing protein [Candidatus Poribacteria bacterium]|nr:T9SS type A sorting domain-containing protein [Candidatus Poribacteria bacterium]MYC39523.1 T9SS type A sorting domain-containing protein [Candidatus Dadabacteria bacterium]
MLIGIVSEGNRKTMTLAAPVKNVKVLLNSVPADLVPLPPPRTYPQRTFKIRNQTGVPVHYQIRWSNKENWESSSLETGFIITHRSSGQSIPSSYPKIRFDHIAGDGQQVTYRVYSLDSAIGNTNVAPTYRFAYNQRGDRLDLYRDGFAAPTRLSELPKETVLLSNYPNPFNPETWIPYKLSKSAVITIAIHSADGKLVRTLGLGHQPAGVYQDKSRAAYWDGKNELGEPVASGVYFYTLKAADFTATRKMLIVR